MGGYKTGLRGGFGGIDDSFDSTFLIVSGVGSGDKWKMGQWENGTSGWTGS